MHEKIKRIKKISECVECPFALETSDGTFICDMDKTLDIDDFMTNAEINGRHQSCILDREIIIISS